MNFAPWVHDFAKKHNLDSELLSILETGIITSAESLRARSLGPEGTLEALKEYERLLLTMDDKWGHNNAFLAVVFEAWLTDYLEMIGVDPYEPITYEMREQWEKENPSLTCTAVRYHSTVNMERMKAAIEDDLHPVIMGGVL